MRSPLEYIIQQILPLFTVDAPLCIPGKVLHSRFCRCLRQRASEWSFWGVLGSGGRMAPWESQKAEFELVSGSGGTWRLESIPMLILNCFGSFLGSGGRESLWPILKGFVLGWQTCYQKASGGSFGLFWFVVAERVPKSLCRLIFTCSELWWQNGSHWMLILRATVLPQHCSTQWRWLYVSHVTLSQAALSSSPMQAECIPYWVRGSLKSLNTLVLRPFGRLPPANPFSEVYLRN